MQSFDVKLSDKFKASINAEVLQEDISYFIKENEKKGLLVKIVRAKADESGNSLIKVFYITSKIRTKK